MSSPGAAENSSHAIGNHLNLGKVSCKWDLVSFVFKVGLIMVNVNAFLHYKAL